MTWRGETEDGIGWGGLVPSKAERAQEAREERVRQRLAAAQRVAEALRSLNRYSDGLICYASTMGEHEPNRIVHEAEQALKAWDALK